MGHAYFVVVPTVVVHDKFINCSSSKVTNVIQCKQATSLAYPGIVKCQMPSLLLLPNSNLFP